ncbi:MAG: DNA double-strand break repair nuclease NurA [Candidatus Thorarchaeota archaeon]
MPHFLDLFLSELQEKRDAFRRRLTGEESTDLDGYLKTAFQREWRELPSEKKPELQVIAVDSGRSTREYASGSFMYICRASAITSWGSTYRKVSSNAHMIASPREQLIDLASIRSEHIEHQVALEAVKDASDVDLILLDGSLYGRITHVPIAFNYPGERDLYLRYMQTFMQLLEECRKRKILILGISKDSVARHLTRILLESVKTKILQELTPALKLDELDQLAQLFDIEKKQSISARSILKALPLSDKQSELLWDLFYELRRPRPDFSLIHAWTETAGYTTPIEPYPDVPLFKYESKDPAAYVRRRFVNAYNDYDHEDEFEKWAIPVMQNVFQIPTFVTFCAKFAYNDTPLRIDLPAFSAGLPTRISQISSSRLLDPPPARVTEILRILRGEYGGLELYNAYLVKADQEARLPTSDVRTLYEPLIEKELKIPLIPKRRERRVRRA